MVPVGLAALILFGGFVALALLRVPIAFALLAVSLVLFTMEARLDPWGMTQEIYSGLDSFVLLAVPFFVLAGNIMNESRVTDRLIRLAYAIVGSIRGGLGMVNVAVSMVFAGISGSSTADTAGVGTVLIPQMRERGYSAGFTVSVTAASSVMGSIIPPSILLIVWGSLTNTSIGALFLGGVVPGALIGLSMMSLVYVIARRRGYPREARISFSEVGRAFVESFLAIGIPVVVIGGIVFGIVTATEASVLAVLYALILGLLIYRTVGVKDLPQIFSSSARLASLSLFALAAASVFAYLLSYYQMPFALQDLISGLSPVVLMPVIALMWLLIGTFMDALPAMAIMVPIFEPAVTASGLDPVHYGIVSIVALSIGLITPPYGLCLLLASAIADIPVVQALSSVVPFLLLLIAILILILFVPQTVLWLPETISPATGQ